MPWFSYHGGHSGEFCRHAKGRLEEVVERAWEAGFTHYGLSEHCPRIRSEDVFEDEIDLGVEGLERLFVEYQAEAARLRVLYADRLEILVGFETERLPPDDWAKVMARLRAHANPDFIIGSVHHVNARCIDYSKQRTEAVAVEMGGRIPLEQAYFDDLAELVSELRPEIVGHFDLIRKFDGDGAGFGEEVWPRVERALEAIHAANAVLDVNPSAHRRGLSPVYPLPRILKRAREMGISVTLGDDSHGAHDVGVGLDACMREIKVAGYQEVACFRRIDGETQRVEVPV
ncbi:MAG: histidinol-phosphatase, partial [Deltaproteobacteria bacterium]|nr:histidinol-phosphatase [Deltaproteobacteria bacterium]